MTTPELVHLVEKSAHEVDVSDLRQKYTAVLDEDYSNILIIGNIPKVDAAKEEKLMAVLKKSVFSKSKSGCTIKTMDMPKDPDSGMSRGIVLLELESTEQANDLFMAVDGYKLDKAHTLFALRFTDYERLMALDLNAEYQEPEIEPFEQKEHLKSWMMDPLARDQFVCQVGSGEGVVFWNSKVDKPGCILQRSSWTEKGFQWSPLGSFLATHHHQGIAIWGGENWNKIGRFAHKGVQKFMFSPNERFLVTWSPFSSATATAASSTPEEFNLIIWETRSAKIIRGYSIEDQLMPSWPVIQFSHDDSFASRVIGEEFLAIYETTTFTVVDKKPLKVDNIKECSWSPSDHILAYWVHGTDNAPTRLALLRITCDTITVLRTKNLFSVINCCLKWHSEGEYLGLLATRAGKGRKQTVSSLELFRLKHKDVPVDTVELSSQQSTAEVLDVSFEPNGERLLVALKDEFKILVSFYQLNFYDKSTGSPLPTIKLLKTLERKMLSKFVWSPRGDYVLFTGMDSISGYLEFWNVSDFALLNSKEHMTATHAEWDPSGRFVISYISYSRFQTDNAFIIWDFKGEQLSKNNLPKLNWIAWRPRPKSLLSKDQQKYIKKHNLKAYSERFEQEDRAAADSCKTSAAAHRSNLISSWAAFKMRTKERADSKKILRDQLLSQESINASKQQQKVEIEEWVEEVIEEIEETI